MLQLALTCDGAMDLGAILQFNGNRLMAEFHQKPASIQTITLKTLPSFILNLYLFYVIISSAVYTPLKL